MWFTVISFLKAMFICDGLFCIILIRVIINEANFFITFALNQHSGLFRHDFNCLCSDTLYCWPRLESELSVVWSTSFRGKATMQDADRYAFLIASPILIIAELVLLKFYYDNPKIIGRTGIIISVIILFEIFLNLHFFISASSIPSI